MEIKVGFRFNKLTGEVELDVEQDSALPVVEHERSHDRLAAEIGALLERFPQVSEVLPGTEVVTEPGEDATEAAGVAEPEQEPERPALEEER